MTDKHVFASDENPETYQDCDVSLVSGYVVVRNIVHNLTACAAVQTRNKVHINTKSISLWRFVTVLTSKKRTQQDRGSPRYC